MPKDFPERVETFAADGTKLSAGVFRPLQEPKAVVLAGHSMMVNARSMDRPPGRGFLSFLAKRGFLVLAADLRGHGPSGTPVSQGGDWTYDDIIFQDIPAFVNLAKSMAHDKKLIVVGHSLTAHAATAWLGQNPDSPIDAMVLIASNLWLRRDEPNAVRRIKKEIQIAGVSLLFRLFGYFPARKIGMGPEDESAGYIRQFLNVYNKSFWGSADGRIDYRAGLANIKTPLLVVSGKGDTLWCTPYAARKFHENVPADRITFWTVGQGDHGLDSDPGHMDIVTSLKSAPLWAAVADWIQKTLRLSDSPER